MVVRTSPSGPKPDFGASDEARSPRAVRRGRAGSNGSQRGGDRLGPDPDVPAYEPHAVPETASDVARRIVAIANLVPAARWTTYGDLAEAADSSPRGVASALSSVTPLATEQSDILADVHHWVVPWHRIRMDDGREKRERSPESVRRWRMRCTSRRAAESLRTKRPRADSGISYLPSYAGDELVEPMP